MTRKEITAMAEKAGVETIVIYGHDNAITGVSNTKTGLRVVYSVDKILKNLMRVDGMNLDDARDYFHYNIEGSFLDSGNNPKFK